MGHYVQLGNDRQWGGLGAGEVEAVKAAVKFSVKVMRFLGRVFQGGHADDWIDNEEEQIAADAIGPIISEAGVPLAWPFLWPKARQAGSSINPATSPMSAGRALEIIQDMDPFIADRCAAYAAAGYPCPPAQSEHNSGAGRDIKPLWDIVKRKLQQIAQRQGPLSQILPGAGTGSGESPLLPLGLAAAGIFAASRIL